MPLKIAITGKARAGKDEVARILSVEYGFTKFAFGDALKRHYHAIFGDGEAKPREGYQWFGQAMRQRDPDVWVRACFGRIADIVGQIEDGGYAPIFPVITDCRQLNELARCRAEGYVIIRVYADDTTRLERMRAAGDQFDISDLTHDTETQLDGVEADYTVYNGAGVSKADLKAQVGEIMAGLMVRA